MGLEVWRLSTLPSDPPSTYILVASTVVQTLSSGLNTFTTGIDVQQGDLIGMRVDAPAVCQVQILNPDGSPDNAVSFGFSFGATPNVGDRVTMSLVPSYQLNIAATVAVTINPPPPPPTPTTADQCKHGGWQGLTDSNGTLFKNQGDCVSFVATQGTNLAAGQVP